MTDEPLPVVPDYIRRAIEAQGVVSVEEVEERLARGEGDVTSTCPKCNEEVEDLDGFGVLHHPACGYCAHPDLSGGYCVICGKLIRVEQTALDIPAADRESGYGL